LHAALISSYSRPGDRLEHGVDGYFIDLVRDDLLIEIQTGNFSAIRSKLYNLVERHPIRLIYPIAQEKWILRLPADGERPISRRKSPRRGRLEHLFIELVHLPKILNHPNFSLEVLLIQQEDIFRDDGKGSWRRKGWSLADRRLLNIISAHLFSTPGEFVPLLPPDLPSPFTSRQLANGSHLRLWEAQKMLFCLRHMGLLQVAGKAGRSLLLQLTADS
jgi:hypothetical protein